jgi:hypothetical protein
MVKKTEVDEEADPIVLAASIPASLVGAFIGTLVAGPIGLLIGGVVAGSASALITKSIELRAELETSAP